MSEYVNEFSDNYGDVGQEQASLGRESDSHKILVGRNKFRILPALQGEPAPWVIVPVHTLRWPGERFDNFETIPCSAKTGKCRFCKTLSLELANNPGGKKILRTYEASSEMWMRALNRAIPDSPPKALKFSRTLAQSFTSARQTREDEMKDRGITDERMWNIVHPMHGFDITIVRVGEKTDTEYQLTIMTGASPIYTVPGYVATDPMACPPPDLARMNTLPEMMRQITLHERAKAWSDEQVDEAIFNATRGDSLYGLASLMAERAKQGAIGPGGGAGLRMAGGPRNVNNQLTPGGVIR